VSAARVVPYATGRTARRIVACALALSLLVEAVPSARAAGVDGGSNSRIGVVMAAVCGFALKMSIPAPVPWAGIFAFLDAALSPDDQAPAQDPPPKP